MNVVSAPVAGLDMNSRSPVGRTSRITCADDGSSESRSITPTFANGFVFRRLLTRRNTSPLPTSGAYMYPKLSAVPQMSPPAAWISNWVLPRNVALPATPTMPTSEYVNDDVEDCADARVLHATTTRTTINFQLRDKGFPRCD